MSSETDLETVAAEERAAACSKELEQVVAAARDIVLPEAVAETMRLIQDMERSSLDPERFADWGRSKPAEVLRWDSRDVRLRPSPADAVFVRLCELAGGKWNVDIYTPDGWGTLFEADSEKEAEEIVQVLTRQHHLKTRSPVRLSGTATPTTT